MLGVRRALRAGAQLLGVCVSATSLWCEFESQTGKPASRPFVRFLLFHATLTWRHANPTEPAQSLEPRPKFEAEL